MSRAVAWCILSFFRIASVINRIAYSTFEWLVKFVETVLRTYLSTIDSSIEGSEMADQARHEFSVISVKEPKSKTTKNRRYETHSSEGKDGAEYSDVPRPSKSLTNSVSFDSGKIFICELSKAKKVILSYEFEGIDDQSLNPSASETSGIESSYSRVKSRGMNEENGLHIVRGVTLQDNSLQAGENSSHQRSEAFCPSSDSEQLVQGNNRVSSRTVLYHDTASLLDPNSNNGTSCQSYSSSTLRKSMKTYSKFIVLKDAEKNSETLSAEKDQVIEERPKAIGVKANESKTFAVIGDKEIKDSVSIGGEKLKSANIGEKTIGDAGDERTESIVGAMSIESDVRADAENKGLKVIETNLKPDKKKLGVHLEVISKRSDSKVTDNQNLQDNGSVAFSKEGNDDIAEEYEKVNTVSTLKDGILEQNISTDFADASKHVLVEKLESELNINKSIITRDGSSKNFETDKLLYLAEVSSRIHSNISDNDQESKKEEHESLENTLEQNEPTSPENSAKNINSAKKPKRIMLSGSCPDIRILKYLDGSCISKKSDLKDESQIPTDSFSEKSCGTAKSELNPPIQSNKELKFPSVPTSVPIPASERDKAIFNALKEFHKLEKLYYKEERKDHNVKTETTCVVDNSNPSQGRKLTTLEQNACTLKHWIEVPHDIHGNKNDPIFIDWINRREVKKHPYEPTCTVSHSDSSDAGSESSPYKKHVMSKRSKKGKSSKKCVDVLQKGNVECEPDHSRGETCASNPVAEVEQIGVDKSMQDGNYSKMWEDNNKSALDDATPSSNAVKDLNSSISKKEASFYDVVLERDGKFTVKPLDVASGLENFLKSSNFSAINSSCCHVFGDKIERDRIIAEFVKNISRSAQYKFDDGASTSKCTEQSFSEEVKRTDVEVKRTDVETLIASDLGESGDTVKTFTESEDTLKKSAVDSDPSSNVETVIETKVPFQEKEKKVSETELEDQSRNISFEKDSETSEASETGESPVKESVPEEHFTKSSIEARLTGDENPSKPEARLKGTGYKSDNPSSISEGSPGIESKSKGKKKWKSNKRWYNR